MCVWYFEGTALMNLTSVPAEALVEYDYKAVEIDELTIKKGDIITNIDFKPGGWWEGTLSGTSKRGMFPDNFVKVCSLNLTQR